MPFTVITLKKVPYSLRGDLTRWMQEIVTGVYVGNFNSRVREYLWKRVIDSIGNGEATMCYSCRNEMGYSFCTCNTERQVINFDGIPLVLIPDHNAFEERLEKAQNGFSNANKYHKSRRRTKAMLSSEPQNVTDSDKCADSINTHRRSNPDLVFLDIETTGLNADFDQIIEIGAIRISDNQKTEFHRLIHTNVIIPEAVRKLTGITNEMLKSGSSLEISIRDFNSFIQGAVLIGYNLSFDIKFLNKALEKYSMEPIHNKLIDLMHEAKRKNSFQTNFKFETTLKEYSINQVVRHRAFEDASLMYELYVRMNKSE